MPMGSPLPPSAANLVMNELITKVIEQLKFEVPICFLYVDDMLLAIPSDKESITLEMFNITKIYNLLWKKK
jgi:hypothetical protein